MNEKENCSIEIAISELLKKYHIKPNNKAYEYISYILKYSFENNFVPHKQIVDVTYPLIAEKFDTTPTCVERSIRYAIAQTSKFPSYTDIKQLYGHVTNAIFIAILYNELTIDNYTI